MKSATPHHTFSYLNVGQQIKSLERDFTKAKDLILKADLLLFCYPVYTFLAPSQLHRFIELLKKENLDLSHKYATQITTSKHFYDVTAHCYIEDNCKDMHIKYIKGLSADMEDLLTTKGQKDAYDFFSFVLWSIENNHYESLHCSFYNTPSLPVEVPNSTSNKNDGDVVILTDCEKENEQLQSMIARFQQVLPFQSRVINLCEYPFKGGCLGCFHCATSGKCIYTDGFDDFLRNSIQTANAIVYAFSIKDHSMGAIFKQYDDRQFCNGHRTVTMGMPIGYLVSGNYSREFNLQMVIEARCQVGSNFLAGVASDEFKPNESIDKLAETLTYALKHNYVPPQNFYGVGGMKIFRDLIYLMRGMMKADHKFYKAHGQYDFPQKKKGTMLKMYLVGALLSSPKIKAKMGNKLNEGMIAPYKKVLNAIKAK